MEPKHTSLKFGIGSLRVSSSKQGLIGDSPEDQKKQIEVRASSLGIKIIKYFKLIESASGELQPNQKVIDYCKENQGKIGYFFIKSIDRFTRGGAYFYDFLNMQLVKYGIQLIDVYGVIGTQSVNTLEDLGLKYKWSIFNPTRTSELLEAERGKNEIRDILTRMIRAEINYVRMGYSVREARMGYINEKIDTPVGRRVILKPHLVEAKWFIRMYELRIQGNLSDEEIVKEINILGFKTKVEKLHDKENPSKIIGYRGGQPLTVKKLQYYLQNPIYAGVNYEKWTKDNPIKTKFEGLVTIEMFNKANRGKICIREEGGLIKIYKGNLPMYTHRRNRNNPNYPYKYFVLCPICKNPLLGSASKGQSGNHYGAYHCNRKHYFRKNINDFNKTINNFCKKLKFSNKFIKRFREILLEEWDKRQQSLSKLNISFHEQVASKESEINMIKEKIKLVTSETVIKLLSDDIEKLQNEKIVLVQKLNNKEDEQIEVETLIAYAEYLMEHLHDLLLGGSDKDKNAGIFGLIFDTLPTYEDLVNGTVNLSPLFKLNDAFVSSKNDAVSPDFPEWNTFEAYMYKVYQTFNQLQVNVQI